ncbi:MAG TPA: PQQ-binding-like beta-propeller repeat protein, partial [Gemmataceae bacterium]|nr:PQQ-binding-like beta-propeller repeat protein [Gemmataceae bacterium]
LQWGHRIEHGGGRCALVPAHNLVVAGGNDGFAHAVDTNKTAATRWQTSLLEIVPPDPPNFPGQRARLSGSLARPTGIACDDERVYISVFDQSRIVGLDARTGKLLWSFQANGWIYGDPVTSGDYVFIGSQDKHMYCLDKRSGAKVWEFATKGRIESAAAASDGSLYFGSCDGGYYRLALADGKLLWRYDSEPDAAGHRAIYSTPVLTADSVYFAAGAGHVYALDRKTGELRWKLRAERDSQTFCSPASDGARLFVVTRPHLNKAGENSLLAISQR